MVRLLPFALATALFFSCNDDELVRLRSENQELRNTVAKQKTELDDLKFGARNLLNAAQVAQTEGRYDEAINGFQELILKYPASDEAVEADRLLKTAQQKALEVKEEEE